MQSLHRKVNYLLRRTKSELGLALPQRQPQRACFHPCREGAPSARHQPATSKLCITYSLAFCKIPLIMSPAPPPFLLGFSTERPLHPDNAVSSKRSAPLTKGNAPLLSSSEKLRRVLVIIIVVVVPVRNPSDARPSGATGRRRRGGSVEVAKRRDPRASVRSERVRRRRSARRRAVRRFVSAPSSLLGWGGTRGNRD